MSELMAWIVDNKQWLFSGAGLMVLAAIGRLIFKRTKPTSAQTIRSGDHSTNVQANRDINL